MKPKEFDELVRQKFDQNDFAYNPKNWDQLAEKLDGRAQKRSIMMWWWVPVVGMAASVALAMGIAPVLNQGTPAGPGAGAGVAQAKTYVQPEPAQGQMITTQAASTHKEQLYANATTTNRKQINRKPANVSDGFHVVLNDKAVNTVAKTDEKFDFAAGNKSIKTLPKSKKEDPAIKDAYNTFKPEEEEVAVKPPKVMIILSGGYNHGSQSSGYAAGATFRRMLNDKVYIESDVAFATSSNSQSTQVWVPTAANGSAARHAIAAKTSAPQAASKSAPATAPQGSVKTEEQDYNLSYAQVSPSIGYKVIRRMSVGLGPDFQQMLVDNRPATSTVDRGNIQVAPVFDIGFLGKTEYSLTKKIKAGVSYRKGVNNLINPINKYIDRDYLQFQLKCTIFNR